jgi:hypothetical protein
MVAMYEQYHSSGVVGNQAEEIVSVQHCPIHMTMQYTPVLAFFRRCGHGKSYNICDH